MPRKTNPPARNLHRKQLTRVIAYNNRLQRETDKLHHTAMIAAVEFGFRSHEIGKNLTETISEAIRIMK